MKIGIGTITYKAADAVADSFSVKLDGSKLAKADYPDFYAYISKVYKSGLFHNMFIDSVKAEGQTNAEAVTAQVDKNGYSYFFNVEDDGVTIPKYATGENAFLYVKDAEVDDGSKVTAESGTKTESGSKTTA